MKADLHPRQGARLAALSAYDILDTPPEDAFSEVVGLVSRICDMPVALVSLVEEHRQWFKARKCEFVLPKRQDIELWHKDAKWLVFYTVDNEII